MHNGNVIEGALITKHSRCCQKNRNTLREEHEVREMKTNEHGKYARRIAEELPNDELLIETTRPLTSVVPQCEEESTELEIA